MIKTKGIPNNEMPQYFAPRDQRTTNSEQRFYARAAIAGSAADIDAEAALTSSGFQPALRISTPPLKNAPSSIEMRVATQPTPERDAAAKSVVRKLPDRLP